MFALFLAAAASTAQPTPNILFRKVGTWRIERSDQMCFATSAFGTNYSMIVGVNRALRISLGVSSDLWKWSNGTKLDTLQEMGGKTYSGGETTVVAEDGVRTMITGMSFDFLTAWRTSKNFDVFEDVDDYGLGDEPLVSLTFDDNGPIVDALIACSKQLPGPAPVAPPTPPRPPAAPPAPPMPSVATKPAYLNRPEVILSDDYPKDARKAGITGTTYYRVFVSALGAPTGCIVTTSSGSPVLDAKSCELIMARAKFSPARDTRGRAIKGELDARVIWRF